MKPGLRWSKRYQLTLLILPFLAASLPIEMASGGQETKIKNQDALESLRRDIQELKESITQDQLAKALRERDDILLRQLGKSVEVILNEKDKETWSQSKITLIAVIIGAIVSFISSICFQAWLRYLERRSLQGAFVGEFRLS